MRVLCALHPIPFGRLWWISSHILWAFSPCKPVFESRVYLSIVESLSQLRSCASEHTEIHRYSPSQPRSCVSTDTPQFWSGRILKCDYCQRRSWQYVSPRKGDQAKIEHKEGVEKPSDLVIEITQDFENDKLVKINDKFN